ncbi:hypothetical protein EJB05_28660, partial [Eragrostis curvula]
MTIGAELPVSRTYHHCIMHSSESLVSVSTVASMMILGIVLLKIVSFVIRSNMTAANALIWMFILERYLKKWPTFSKLKTLLLNEQLCVAPDFHALTCILKHSPVLEKLTLQLFCKGHEHKFGMKGVRNSMDISAALSEHLKIVEVKSVVIDDCILKVLKFLSTLNFRFSLDEVEILED